MPGFPVLYQLLEFAQIHVHWASDAIQPSHPLSLPSLPALNLSQHQSFPMSWLFATGGQNVGASVSASVLPMNIQGWFPLGLTDLIFLLSNCLLSLLQHHNSKASILQRSGFFIVQISGYQQFNPIPILSPQREHRPQSLKIQAPVGNSRLSPALL